MRLLLLTAGLSLLSVVRAQKFLLTPANSQELLGDWHIVRWAGNMPIPHKKNHPLPPFKFVKNKLNKLEFRMNLMKPIGCIQFQLPLDVTSSGNFQTWWKHTISVQFLRGKEHAIAYFKDRIHTTFQMMMLMGTLDNIWRCVIFVMAELGSWHPGMEAGALLHTLLCKDASQKRPLPKGRTLEEDPEALRIFEKFVKDKRLNKIIAPPHLEACKLPRES